MLEPTLDEYPRKPPKFPGRKSLSDLKKNHLYTSKQGHEVWTHFKFLGCKGKWVQFELITGKYKGHKTKAVAADLGLVPYRYGHKNSKTAWHPINYVFDYTEE